MRRRTWVWLGMISPLPSLSSRGTVGFASIRTRSSADVPTQFATAKIGAVTWLLPFDEIRLVAACENYTEVVLADDRRLLVRRTMLQWAVLLPDAQFARVQRSLFINLDHIARVERQPGQPTRLHFTAGLRFIEVKRRHWPA